jgi:hypothetical protein
LGASVNSAVTVPVSTVSILLSDVELPVPVLHEKNKMLKDDTKIKVRIILFRKGFFVEMCDMIFGLYLKVH